GPNGTERQDEPTKKQAAIPTGDPGGTDFAGQLKTMLTRPVQAGGSYSTLASVGISTGAFGAAAHSTNHLILDSGKLNTALQNNPQSVYNLFSGAAVTVVNPNADGTPSVSATPPVANAWLGTTSGAASGAFGS